jgi:hypothetical protein
LSLSQRLRGCIACALQRLEAQKAQWLSERRRKDKVKEHEKRSKADAERQRAKELAEAEEAIVKCASCSACCRVLLGLWRHGNWTACLVD